MTNNEKEIFKDQINAPDYGDLYTINAFIDCVDCGGFLDSDGYGELCHEHSDISEEINTEYVKCNVPFLKEAIKQGYTHVMWYNK